MKGGPKRKPLILWACLLQAAAAYLGLAWGWKVISPERRERIGDRWTDLEWLHYRHTGLLSLVLLSIPLTMSPCGRAGLGKRSDWVCLGVLVYEMWIMVSERFLYGERAADLVVSLLLLMPLLFAMGYFARVGVWSAACGTAVFFATSIAMVIENGHRSDGSRGFFTVVNV